MDIIYKLNFKKRITNGIKPCYYIGSKSSCHIDGEGIKDKCGNLYLGSSKYKDYHYIAKQDDIEVELLCVVNGDYNMLLELELYYHIKYDVISDPAYFNLSLATINNYSNPEYATYKNINYDKCVRLRRDDHRVLSGEYVGVTKGLLYSDERKYKISQNTTGENNPFFDKSHSDITKDKIRCANLGKKHSEETKIKMSISKLGISKSDDHKKKIGRSGMITIKNIETGECIRICKDIIDEYPSNLWINPYKYKIMFGSFDDVICDSCGKTGKNNSSFKRWHFDNCKRNNKHED